MMCHKDTKNNINFRNELSPFINFGYNKLNSLEALKEFLQSPLSKTLAIDVISELQVLGNVWR